MVSRRTEGDCPGRYRDPLSYGFRCRWKDGAGEAPYPKQSYFRDLRRFIIDETLVHHIDTARFLFGDIQTVYAEAMRVNPQIQERTMRDPDSAAYRADDGMDPATASSLLRMQAHRLTNQYSKEKTDRSVSLLRARYGLGHKKIWTQNFSTGVSWGQRLQHAAPFRSMPRNGRAF